MEHGFSREDIELLRDVADSAHPDEKPRVQSIADRLEEAVEFTPIDAHAVHRAMIDAKEQAKQRADKMPSSSIAFDQQANDLKTVRNKILDLLPADVHRSYPDYEKERSLSPAEIEERYGAGSP
jgi:hypothetical protein